MNQTQASQASFADKKTITGSSQSSMKSQKIRIELLGEFSVLSEGSQRVGGEVWRRTHPRRLLQLVGSQRRRTLSRTQVLEALWPSLDESHGRNRLHHTIHLIRKHVEALGTRKNIVIVDGDYVTISDDIDVDVTEFLGYLDSEGSDAHRLACLLSAIELYRGDLAADWLDSHAIETRRVAIRRCYVQGLAEAAELSRDSGDMDRALALALRRVTVDPVDVAAHVNYATLLVDSGRSDLAAAHCRSARRQICETSDASAALPLEDLLVSIQRRSNRSAQPDAEAAFVACPESCAGGRLTIAAPNVQLYGRDGLVDEICRDLEDPYYNVVTLCGPPGIGRSSVALHVSMRMQMRLRDGAVHVKCAEAHDDSAFCSALAEVVRPLAPHASTSLDALAKAIAGREMVILVEGIGDGKGIARAIATLSAAARDCKFLVCAQHRLRLSTERVIRMDFLLGSDEVVADRSIPLHPAVTLLIEQARPNASTRALDRRHLRDLFRIVELVEGWPLALIVVGRRLNWMQPQEIIAWLENWRAATDVGDEPLEQAMIQWTSAAAESLPTLVKAACFEGWFTRSDLAFLLERPPRSQLDTFIDSAVECHVLKRRIVLEPAGEVSEYKIPFLLRNWLRARSIRGDVNGLRMRHAMWLQWKLASAEQDRTSSPAAQIASLAAQRHADIESVTAYLFESKDVTLLDQIVRALLPGLRISSLSASAITWITRAIECFPREPSFVAHLLFERALIHLRAGSSANAASDVQSAYQLSCDLGVAHIKLQAADLMQILGRESGNHFAADIAGNRRHPIVSRGVEAGESLLRIARSSARFGEFITASELSSKASEVFRHFGCTLGELRALRYCARMAFAMGDLESVATALRQLASIAVTRDISAEAARGQLMLAEVALAQEDFHGAMQSAGRLLSGMQRGDPVVELRALKIICWSLYADGQTAVADLVQREYSQRAEVLSDSSHIANSQLLRALIVCERGDRSNVHSLVTQLHSLMISSAGPIDVQAALADVAYLSACLGRVSIAMGLLRSLTTFASRPRHRLRPLTQARVLSTKALVSKNTDRSTFDESQLGTNDALAQLVSFG